MRGLLAVTLLILPCVLSQEDKADVTKLPRQDKDKDGFPDAQIVIGNDSGVNDETRAKVKESIRDLERDLRTAYQDPKSKFKKDFKCAACLLYSSQLTELLAKMRKRTKSTINEVDFVSESDLLCKQKLIQKFGIASLNEFQEVISASSPPLITENYRTNTLTGSWVTAGLGDMCQAVVEHSENVYTLPVDDTNAPYITQMICHEEMKVCSEDGTKRKTRHPSMYVAGEDNNSEIEQKQFKEERDLVQKKATKAVQKLMRQFKDTKHNMKNTLRCNACTKVHDILFKKYVNITAQGFEVTDFRSLCPTKEEFEVYGFEWDPWSGSILPKFTCNEEGTANVPHPVFNGIFLHEMCNSVAFKGFVQGISSAAACVKRGFCSTESNKRPIQKKNKNEL